MADRYNIPTEENLKPSPTRTNLSAISVPSLKITNGEIYEEARRELRYPYCINTYQQMVLEPTIASALSLLEILISRSEWKVVVPDKSSDVEKQRGASINWSMQNMKRPWEDYIIEFLAYMQWGFQPVEKVFTKITSGEFKGNIGLKDFRSISPTTVSKWIYEISTGDLAGLRQSLQRVSSDFSRTPNKDVTKIDIPRKRFMLFRYNAKLDNPQGNSPLKSCFISWKQKSVVEDYELINIARGLGGVPKIGVDINFLSKASEAGSDEAKALAEMDRQAAMLHAGEQAFVRMPIAYDDQGKPLFTFELLDVTGGGVQNPEDIIKRLENKMLMAFLADVLKLGTEAQGSYALADSKTTLLSMGAEHHLKIIQRVLNHDLIKDIYARNGWEYIDGQSGKFEYGDIEERDIEGMSKAMQRLVSVGAVRPTKDLEDYALESMGVKVKEESEMTFIETENNSKSGTGNGTSGQGKTAQNNSDSNNDNAA